jgi:Uma2 family endonuclease
MEVEVVSTNWQDDYLVKVAEYERLGIPEYWVVDCAALGGRRFIGNPKQPTVSIQFTSWLMGSTRLASSERAIGLFRLPSGNLI